MIEHVWQQNVNCTKLKDKREYAFSIVIFMSSMENTYSNKVEKLTTPTTNCSRVISPVILLKSHAF